MSMRARWVSACGFVLAVSCYSPSIKNKGYACSEESPSCPAGFYCVDGLCQDTPGSGLGEKDMSVADAGSGGAGGHGGTGGDGGGGGGAVDMSVAAKPDMTIAADMAQCTAGQSGDLCLQDSDCCSGVCVLIVCA
jgi:hypothetical protein